MTRNQPNTSDDGERWRQTRYSVRWFDILDKHLCESSPSVQPIITLNVQSQSNLNNSLARRPKYITRTD